MKTRKKQNGFIVGSLLVIMLVISVLIVTVMSTTISNFQSATKDQFRVNAQFAADAGLDLGIHRLNLNGNWAGTSGEVNFYTTSAGKSIRTTYDVTIMAGSNASKKLVTSKARVYSPSTGTTAKFTRIYQLEVEAVTSGNGPGSVVSGVGGLILDNNSKISGGDVIVNGKVTVNNGAQIGLSTNPVNLRVAHQSCPLVVNSTYPQVCTSGQPITNGGLIYADVQAQNQTVSTGMSSPGLTSSVFAPIAVPGYDRAAHKAAVVNTYAPNNAAVSCGNNQTKTWPANVKITGNINLGNNCTVTVSGKVWITGNVTFGSGSKIKVADSLGSTRTVVMIDGSAGFTTGNNTQIVPNSIGTGLEVVTVWWNTNIATNGGFTCGGIADPYDCAAVTGLALSTSQTTVTINLSNNANASGTVFRTLWSKASISNNGALGAVAGQTIQLGSNAVINFTASIAGSSNLTTAWVKRGYLRVFQ